MSASQTTLLPVRPDLAWDVAYLFPPQGQWSEWEYLALPGNRLVEYANGHIEVLPMPFQSHQRIVRWLLVFLEQFVRRGKLGQVLPAPMAVRLWRGKYREPDILFMLAANLDRCGEKYWRGADLVMEVVSPDAESRRRDLVEKRAEYERAHIPEYWIVDPRKKNILVLRLKGKKYVVHGEFGPDEQATSTLLKGFTVDVTAALSGGEE